MSKNLLNYEGLQHFLSKLQTYIENQRTVKNVDTNASNGINLSNDDGTLDVTVTPGSIANGDTGLVTGDAVFDALALKEDLSNKVNVVNSNSTDIQYPTAKAVYNAIPRDDYNNQYLTLRFNANCPLKFTPRNGYKLFYKLDDNDWEQLTEEISVIGGSKVLLKGDTSEMTSTGRIGSFEDYVGNNQVPSRVIDIYGNVMSLLYGDNFRDNQSTMGDFTFSSLFEHCKWVRYLENLILPATTLSVMAYANMFSDCGCITPPRTLPAMYIAQSAYTYMFSYTNITEAPDILATSLGESGCSYMFYSCRYLVKPPVLRVTYMMKKGYEGYIHNKNSVIAGCGAGVIRSAAADRKSGGDRISPLERTDIL